MNQIEQLKAAMEFDNGTLERCLLRLYKNQTEQEQLNATTTENNGIGFNGTDAYILTKYVEQLKKGFHLTEKQINLTRRKMIKYAKQLVVTNLSGQYRPPLNTKHHKLVS